MNFNFNFIVGGNQLPLGFARDGGASARFSRRISSHNAGPRRFRRAGLGPEALRLILAADYDLEDMSDLIVNQLHDTYMEAEAEPRPVSVRALRALERKRACDLQNQDSTCSICLETYAKRDCCIQLPCGHAFHAKCVERWFRAQHTCPTCRHALPEQTKEEEIELAREANRTMVCEALSQDGAAAAVSACCPGDPCAIFDMVDVSLASAKLECSPARPRRRQRPSRHISILNLGLDSTNSANSASDDSTISNLLDLASSDGLGESDEELFHGSGDDDFYFDAGAHPDALYAHSTGSEDDILLEELLRHLAGTETRSSLEVRQGHPSFQRGSPVMLLPNGQHVDAVDETTLRAALDEIGVEHDEFDDVDDLRMMVSIILRESSE